MKNPVAQAEAPKRARVRLDVWTESQTLLFLSEAKAASLYYPLYLFLIGTGVRIGEALGVTWHDLSTREGTVTIAQALQRPLGGGYTLKNPKTLGSERTIAPPDEGMTSLQRRMTAIDGGSAELLELRSNRLPARRLMWR